MQFMIDTNGDSLSSLRAIAALIVQACDERATPIADPDLAADYAEQSETRKTAAEVFSNAATLPEGFQPVGDPSTHMVGGANYVPPPPPPVDTSTARPASPPPPASADVDSAGVAWDANIHSSSKAKIGNGTWKKKRNTGKTAPPPPPPPMQPATGTVTTQAPAGAPAAPPPPPPPPPAAPAAPTGPTFRSVVAKLNAAVAAQKITHDRVRELCVAAGCPDLTTLNAMAHLIPTVDALADAELAGK